MIQRVQTIYLALAFLCAVLALVFPIFSLDVVTEGMRFETAFGAYGMVSGDTEGAVFATREVPFYMVIIFLALLTALPIFLYKNRRRQLIFSRISLVFHILVGAALFGAYYVVKPMIREAVEKAGIEAADLEWTMGIGFYLLIAPIGFIILANRGIKNDEKLVKSLD